VWSIGNLFNDDTTTGVDGDNETFGASRGTTDPVTFTIANGGTTYFTAELNNFFIEDSGFGPRLLLNSFTDGILLNPTFNVNGSQYITELQNSYNSGATITLGGNFSFNSGYNGVGTAFIDSATGTFNGKLGVIVPEPVSMVLFIVGAGTLAAINIRKKRCLNII
jgi:hypothetical protein